MQNRIRKIRSSRGHRSARSIKAPGILGSQALIAFIPFIIFSCAGHRTSRHLEKKFSSHVQAVCLTGEGKGRISAGVERYMVDIESRVDNKKSLWSVGVEIPALGYETLFIDWSEAQSSRMKASGTFYARLAHQLNGSPQKKIFLKKFLQELGYFLYTQSLGVAGIEKEFVCQNKTCQHKSLPIKWKLSARDGNFSLRNQLNNKFYFSITGFGKKDGHYKRVKMGIWPFRNNASGRRVPLVSLDYFVSECGLGAPSK